MNVGKAITRGIQTAKRRDDLRLAVFDFAIRAWGWPSFKQAQREAWAKGRRT